MSTEITIAREAMAVGIAANAAIQAFVAASFSGAVLKVFREKSRNGVDGQKYCPCVVLGPSALAEPEGDKHVVEYALPVGVYMSIEGVPVLGDDNVYRDAGGAACSELLAMVEAAASKALLAAGFPYEQSPSQPDDVDWNRFHMGFILYRINTRRILA